METILAIIGPTASGKSTLALSIAKKVDGEIIGLDSRQIYKDMPIGTAQPTEEDRKRIYHHLIGIREPTESVSAGEYAELVLEAIDTAKKRGKTPIICGGSGLYFRALSTGIFEGSMTNESIREKLEKDYDAHGSELMLNRLKKIDPDYAEIVHPHNRKRLVRALEIYESTGDPPSVHFKKQDASETRKIKTFTVLVLIPPDKLENRIRNRTKTMLKSGWIDETKHLQEKYGVDNVHALDSIGYKQIIQVLDGEITREVMEEEIVIRTRQYAKRQRTWFRKENIDLEINPDDYSNEKDIIETILVRMNK
ncbi:MAG: tRNA (adenosine(37)-N6)-dimethylallyltransferase MiaA [Candidatus Marinimicrobia bacterium]|nr:tRNA (adenosine(37)-N6)-dimethylallyltransferase MiaA [Candidatus Neomarinimicrobiota bacterium]